jgi:hypothetical protein
VDRKHKIALAAAGVGIAALLLLRRRASAAAAAVPCSSPAAQCLGLESGAYARYEYEDARTLSGPTYVRCESLDGAILEHSACASVESAWPELNVPLVKRLLMGTAGRFVLS